MPDIRVAIVAAHPSLGPTEQMTLCVEDCTMDPLNNAAWRLQVALGISKPEVVLVHVNAKEGARLSKVRESHWECKDARWDASNARQSKVRECEDARRALKRAEAELKQVHAEATEAERKQLHAAAMIKSIEGIRPGLAAALAELDPQAPIVDLLDQPVVGDLPAAPAIRPALLEATAALTGAVREANAARDGLVERLTGVREVTFHKHEKCHPGEWVHGDHHDECSNCNDEHNYWDCCHADEEDAPGCETTMADDEEDDGVPGSLAQRLKAACALCPALAAQITEQLNATEVRSATYYTTSP